MVNSLPRGGQVAKHVGVLGRPELRCYARRNCAYCQSKSRDFSIGGVVMGKSARERPKRLAAKLSQIRVSLGLSQNQMLAALGLTEKVSRSMVSGYEVGRREPPLLVLLRYSQLAGVHMEVLVDDELDLPQQLPATRVKESRKRN
jgi:Helix-turn-helix